MFDTMTMTKTLGALCGTFLVFLLGNWAAESLYHVGPAGHGDDHAMAYQIGSEEEEGQTETVEVSFAEVLATADVDKGAKVFGKCKACHKLDAGANSTGPTLFAIVGRDIGSVEEFGGYSGIMTELPGDWTAEALNDFLLNPKKYAAGTKMTFSGLSKIGDRANLIAFLGTIGG